MTLAQNTPARDAQYVWFSNLSQRAHDCTRCPRMEAHSAVLGPLNGRIDSRVLFIGEAPGRFGSARTRVPFVGDRSGINFDRLLPFARLKRATVFITNAVLCNPKDEQGRNDKPTRLETRNCSQYLQEALDIIRPSCVVTLGNAALAALDLLEPHQIRLRDAVGNAVPWHNTTVVPLYHPGARAMAVRGFERMAEDYKRLGAALNIVIQPTPQDLSAGS